MKLTIGKITQKNLAQWFGISESHMRKEETKARYFPILATYADYHFEGPSSRKTLVIDFVYIDEYAKPESPFSIILQRFNEFWSPTRLDTMREVAKRFLKEYPNWNIKLETCITYVNRAKVTLYGHNYLPDHGEQGSSHFEWALRNKETRYFEKLPTNDQAKITEINKKVYSGLADEISKMVFAHMQGNLTTEELEESLKYQIRILKDEKYVEFIELLNEELGYVPDCVTEIIQEQHFEEGA